MITYQHVFYFVYVSGPMDYMSMVKFLQQVIKPLNRLTSSDSLIELVSVCDVSFKKSLYSNRNYFIQHKLN